MSTLVSKLIRRFPKRAYTTNISSGLTDQQKEFAKIAKTFADKEFAPNMLEWDCRESTLCLSKFIYDFLIVKQHFPTDQLRQAASLGFGAIYCKEEFGGTGISSNQLSTTNKTRFITRRCINNLRIPINRLCIHNRIPLNPQYVRMDDRYIRHL